MYRVLGNILSNFDPKVKVKDRKAGTCNFYHPLQSSVIFDHSQSHRKLL